jgi:hypothetical protein
MHAGCSPSCTHVCDCPAALVVGVGAIAIWGNWIRPGWSVLLVGIGELPKQRCGELVATDMQPCATAAVNPQTAPSAASHTHWLPEQT